MRRTWEAYSHFLARYLFACSMYSRKKRDYFRAGLRGELGFADFKARLKTHGGGRVLEEVLIP